MDWRLLEARLPLLRLPLEARLPLRLPPEERLPLRFALEALPLRFPLEARPLRLPPEAGLPLDARPVLPLPLRALGLDRVFGADPFPDEPPVRLRGDCEDFVLWAM